MGFFGRLFGKQREDHQPATMPWNAKPSIYDHIVAHIIEGKPGLPKVLKGKSLEA